MTDNIIEFKELKKTTQQPTLHEQVATLEAKLEQSVQDVLAFYFDIRDNAQDPLTYLLYQAEAEPDLFKTIYEHAGFDEEKAAKWLRVDRFTLRNVLNKNQQKAS